MSMIRKSNNHTLKLINNVSLKKLFYNKEYQSQLFMAIKINNSKESVVSWYVQKDISGILQINFVNVCMPGYKPNHDLQLCIFP